MKSSNEKVNDSLKDIETALPGSAVIVEKMGVIILKGNSEIEEDIKYGGIYLYKEHISIEFSNGTNYSDPRGFL
ncbi:MAG: hypothetical protein ACC651_07700 [Candidatus Scalindua sp.]